MKDYQVSVALLHGGANPNVTNTDSETMLEVILNSWELKRLFPLLLKNGADLKPILNATHVNDAPIPACISSNEALVASLLKQGANPYYLMPSYVAIFFYKLLIWAGVVMPITAVISSRSEAVLKRILDASVDPQWVNGIASIQLCMNSDQQHLIPILIEAGAYTVLHLATAEGHDQWVPIHNDTPLKQRLQFFPGETIPQAELLEDNKAPSGPGISFWQAIRDSDLDRDEFGSARTAFRGK